jgi:amino acid transporter
MTDRVLVPPPERPSLVRAIGRWDLTAAVINGVIGSSIFGMPAVLAALTGAWSPLAALVAAAGILAITLCHAETASRFKEPGGPYLYGREAYGRAVGFQAGWLSFWIRVTSMGANLNVFVDYLGQIVPAAAAGAGRATVMFALAATVTALNVIGVRQGARAVDLFTIAKLLPLLLLVVLGLGRISGEVLATQAVAAPDWTQAVLLLIFAYGGFEAALIPASEAKDPRRDSAFALLAGLAVVAVT